MSDGFELDFEIRADHLVDFLRVRQRLLNRAGGILAIVLIVLGIYFTVQSLRDRVLQQHLRSAAER